MSANGKPTRSREFLRMYSERWMALKLCLPLSWDAGVTTSEQRREVIRQAILERGIADELVTRGDGSRKGVATWRSLFFRVYQTQLQTTERELAMTGTER